MYKIIPLEREIATEEFYETVRNIMGNEYLTNSEKEVVKKLVSHYKLKRASEPLYTTDSIESLKILLNTLYAKLYNAQYEENEEEVESIHIDIAHFEEKLFEELEELRENLNDFDLYLESEEPKEMEGR